MDAKLFKKKKKKYISVYKKLGLGKQYSYTWEATVKH